MGFAGTGSAITWNSASIQNIATWGELANIETANLAQGARDALLLTEIMTHASMILIFICVLGFIYGLFRAVATWLRA